MRVGLIALILFLPCVARAELASLFGMGPVSAAMGGSALVVGEYSPFQVYAAPAALGFLRRVEVSAGAQYFEPGIRPFGTINLNSGGQLGNFPDAGVLPGGGSTLGFALPIGKTRPLVLAGAIYMPFETLIRVSGPSENYPFYPLYNDLSRNFFFVVGAGFEIFDGWAIGVNMRSTTRSTAAYVLRSDNSVSDSASAVEAKSESRLSYSLVYDNTRFRPAVPWSAGLMYRNYASMETRLAVDVSAFVPVQGALLSLPTYTPAEWVLMGSVQPYAWGKASLDLARVKWSRYSSPYSSGNVNTYVIGAQRPAPNFRDITVVRFGLAQEFPQSGWVKKITYREGYQYHPSPVPDQTGDSNYVDCNRHLFSAGLGLGFNNPWQEGDLIDLDFFGQYNWLVSRAIVKASSTNVGAPGYVAGGHIWLFGAAASLKF